MASDDRKKRDGGLACLWEGRRQGISSRAGINCATRAGLLVVAVLAVGCAKYDDASVQTSAALGDDLEMIARGSLGLPPTPELYERFLLTLPYTNRRLEIFTFLDRDGEKYSTAVDAFSRRVVDHRVAESDEGHARYLQCGVLDETLCEMLESPANSTGAFPVFVWLRHDQADLDRTLAEDGDVVGQQRVFEAHAAVSRAIAEDAAVRLNMAVGAVALSPAMFAPALSGRLTLEQIERLGTDGQVGLITLVANREDRALANALSLAGWTSNAGWDGTGVSIAVFEARPNDFTFLPPLTVRLPNHDSGTYLAGHSRFTIGMIRNTWTTPGFGNNANLFVANTQDADVFPVEADWAIAQGVTHHSDSRLGFDGSTGLTGPDMYFDYITRQRGLFYARAAGNRDEFFGNPRWVDARGYNTVTVGMAYSDGRIVDGTQPDSPCDIDGYFRSSWRNAGGNQELPHVVAEGGCVAYMNDLFNGTSAATPSITGIAAGLVEVNPSLTFFAEATKAILLASPIRAAGYSPDRCPWRFRPNELGACTLSDGKDGTGLVNGQRARAMAGRRSSGYDPVEFGHDFGFITRSQFDPVSYLLTTKHYGWGPRSCTPSAPTMRVVLAWDSNVSCPVGGSPWECTDTLEMDLDLRVYEEPSGTLVAQSSTTVNSYEHVDIPIAARTYQCWPPGVDWYYRIEIRLANYASLPSTASTFFGLAWQWY